MSAEFSMPVRVYYEDTDSGGVVYHANYVKFFERARTEWLRALGFEQDALVAEQDIIFAVHSMQIDFLQPARFNELLQVTSRLARRRRASLEFEQSIQRDHDQATLCTGRFRVACVQASTLKPCAIPSMIQQRMESRP